MTSGRVSKAYAVPLWQKFSLLFVALAVVLGGASLLEVARLKAAGDAQMAVMDQSLRTIQEDGSVSAGFNRCASELQTFTSAAVTGQPTAEAQSLAEFAAARDQLEANLPALGRSGPVAALCPLLARYFASAKTAQTEVLHGHMQAALRLEASQIGELADQVDHRLSEARITAAAKALSAEARERDLARTLDLQILFTILLAIALTVMASVFAARYLTRRLASLTRQADAVSREEGDIALEATPFPDEIDTLTRALAAMTANLRERAEEIRKTQWQVLEELVAALEKRDAYSAGHSRRVMVYAVHLARRLGLPPHEVEIVRRAALMHDIGKIALPGGILDSTGSLSEEQWAVMRQHTVVGAEILGHVPWLQDTLPAVRGHHERWDGFGYPDRLVGEAIPLLARILAVADAYDAITTTRSYRDARSPQQALEILRQGAGSQWDPACVREMVTMVGTAPALAIDDGLPEDDFSDLLGARRHA